MTSGWETKKLGDVCSFLNRGISPKYVDKGGIAVVNQRCIRDHRVDYELAKRHDVTAKKVSNERIVQIGDVLVNSTGSGTLGRVAQVRDDPPERTTVDSHVTIVRPVEGLFFKEFFGYSLRDIEDKLKESGEGCGGQTELNRSVLSERFLVRFPKSLSEQQRIVSILDEAFEGIATAKVNAEKNLQNARVLFDSHLQSIFARRSDEVPLSEVATNITDGDHSPPPKAATGIPFITISDIVKRTREIDFTSTFTVPADYFRNLKPNKKPRVGDVLYTVTGATLGIPVLVKEQRDFCFQRHIGLIRPKHGMDSSWLAYALLSPQVFKQATDGSTGTAQKTVSLSVLRGLKVPRVPLREQKYIAASLDRLARETERLAIVYERKLAVLEELKDSLLDQALSGELSKGSRRSFLVSFPTKVPDITTTDLHAGVLATAYDLHEKNSLQRYFGHVKAEKIAHMVEAHLGIDLARAPIKDAAGPNDYPHLLKVEHRARKAGYFNFERTASGGYRVKKLRQFDKLLARTCEGLGERKHAVDELLELMLPMTTQQAEICATVYAAWNNLLLDGKKPTDEEIVFEARENWHSAKLNIPRQKFFEALEWLREKDVVASGRGNKVSAKSGKT